MNHQSQQIHAWHALDLPSIEQTLETKSGGLSGAGAATRLGKFGPNVLPHTPPPTWWQIVLRQFLSPLIYINEGDLHRRNGEWIWRGDAVDLALLAMAHKLGSTREASLASRPQVNEIPFEPERQFSASYHQADGTTDVFVKGAPERVLAMCDWGAKSHESKGSLESKESHKLEEMRRLAESMGEQGYRVLALAEGTATYQLDLVQTPPEPSNLTFLEFVGMINSLRPGVRDAVSACRDAGVDTCMITGDHPVTALAISRDLGLASEPHQVITRRCHRRKWRRQSRQRACLHVLPLIRNWSWSMQHGESATSLR